MEKKGIASFLAIILVFQGFSGATALADKGEVVLSAPKGGEPASRAERMAWWVDGKYGMFIHWGLYSILGGEWKGKDYGKEVGGASAEWIMLEAKIPKEEYAQLAKRFNPEKFDAKEWVSIAKRAGMKYMVITSKHHDGFCLFDTDQTDYNVMDASPFKRDIIRELATECKKEGIRFGVYYSQSRDWYHRGVPAEGRKDIKRPSPAYIEMVKGHIQELLTDYGDMAVAPEKP